MVDKFIILNKNLKIIYLIFQSFSRLFMMKNWFNDIHFTDNLIIDIKLDVETKDVLLS